MTASLAGRHALVTGGGRGIGAAIATALGTAGAKVTLLGRKQAQLQDTASTLPTARAICCDVTDEAAVGAAFAEARQTFGPVTILVNNAGAAESAPLARTSLELFRRMLDVNLIGTFLCSRAALPDMLDSGLRPVRQRRERGRPQGGRLCFGLLRRQARGHRPDPRARPGDGAQGHHGQRGLPELHRYRHGAKCHRHHRREDRAQRRAGRGGAGPQESASAG